MAAVTNSDSLNAVVAHIPRAFYHVPVVVVRNYDPNLRVVIEAFGLQTVSSTSWGAQRVEELLLKSHPTHGVLRGEWGGGSIRGVHP